MSGPIGEFEQLVLFALARLGDAAYGVAIRHEIEAETGRRVSSGAVYTTLDRLRARGLIASRWGEPTAERGGRRKRFYRLEPEGHRALNRTYEALQRMSSGFAPKAEMP